MTAQAFFLPIGDAPAVDGRDDQRFCLFHPAQAAIPRGIVVHAPAFGEEMNKSRHMVTQQARALAQQGFSVLQIDLLGTGDSTGGFGDARWAAWVADLCVAVRWLRARDSVHAAAPLWFWGLRAGCLLAVEAAAALGGSCSFCFWQPPAQGKTLLQQFLRLKVAAEMMDGGAKGAMEQVKQALAAGDAVEIAGYQLDAELARGLEAARLAPPAVVTPARVTWLEISNQTDAAPSPVAAKAIAEWREAGWQLDWHATPGPAFWQTVEVEDAPALRAATLESFEGRADATPDRGEHAVAAT